MAQRDLQITKLNRGLTKRDDVAVAGIDPYEHFMTDGKAQGRSGCPPKLILHERRQSLYTEKEYVLVVTHEATRMGARRSYRLEPLL